MNYSSYQWMRIAFNLLLLFFTQAASAEPTRRQDPESVFYKAALFYEAAKYDEAITQYSLLLDLGFESGPLYYNLGNCNVKKGNLGRAILNYEKAKRIIPRDSDLISNETYAKSLIRENLGEPSKIWYQKISDKIFEPVSIDELTILLSMTYLLSMAILIAGLYLEPVKRYRKILLTVLVLIFAMSGLGLVQKTLLLEKEAIVVEEKSEAKFEPFDRATNHFILYEGMKVQILASKKDWVKIKQADKKAGWVKASSIEII